MKEKREGLQGREGGGGGGDQRSDMMDGGIKRWSDELLLEVRRRIWKWTPCLKGCRCLKWRCDIKGVI